MTIQTKHSVKNRYSVKYYLLANASFKNIEVAAISAAQAKKLINEKLSGIIVREVVEF